ncbi:chondroitinase family polysaccharide lyase [Vibrio fujianensis]|uniref:chondroitinase family polysaccharide lyase n=1 Tax=Vibrio fujianensis TaxID=1974215 RepID=UPI000C16E660|nr:chondroitinase family polysaccharide lyase [Vibrio fujianensis]
MKKNALLPINKVALLIGSALMAQSAFASLTPTILSFEESSIPTWINSDVTAVSLSTKRAILGDQSLLWQWNAGEKLVINKTFTRYTDTEARALYGSSATQIISFWLYNEMPSASPATLTLANPDGAYPRTTTINLNFTGWRNVTLSLNNDFTSSVPNKFGQIILSAPNTGSGYLYIDRIMVSIDDSRYQWSDDQVTTRYPVEEINFDLPVNLPAPTSAELAAIEQIKTRLMQKLGTGSSNLSSLESKFNSFNIIKRADGTITGRHLITDPQQTPYQPNHLSAQDKADYNEYALLGEGDKYNSKITGYAQLMLNLGKAYHNPLANKDRIAEMYTLMTEHMFDQGFVNGSALGTTHHWGYSGRWWYLSALLMEEPLREAGLLDETYKALLWFSREFRDRGFEMNVTPSSTDMDFFNTLSQQNLAMILLNPDEREKVALLHKYADFLSATIDRNPPGYNDGFRPDGTAWRHKGHYPGYAFPALTSIGDLAYLMKGDEFGFKTGALDMLKKAMISAWIYTNPAVPLGIAGRHPFTDLSVNSSFAESMKNIALSYPTVDKELASIYLTITKQSAAQSVAIFGESITPSTLPEGSWSFNGGAFAVHRVGDRMAIFKGYNQDVWSSEIYTNDNRYGRYQSHGSVHVLPHGDPVNHGYKQEGWDWNRNPGTTTIHLPIDELESPRSSTLMVRSDVGLAGATSLENQYTLFSFKHKAPQNLDRFEPSFEMNKHALGSEKFIYLTGNNIRNLDGSHRTETTLFQLAIRSGKGVNINGISYTGGTLNTTLQSGDWIIDDNNVGYYLVNTDPVKVYRGAQTSKHNKTKAVTSGNFSSAWIDHGVAPNNKQYEYIMVMETTPQEMAQLASAFKAQPRFVTLQSDELRQVVKDTSSNLFGYTNFAESTFTQGYVTHVDKPSQTLLRVDALQQKMVLSGSSLELNYQKDLENQVLSDLTTGPEPVSITYTIKGKWQLSAGEAQVVASDNETMVTLTSGFAMPQEVTLTTTSLPLLPLEPSIPAQPVEPEVPEEPTSPSSSGGSGGSTSPLLMFGLGLLGLLRYRLQ